MNRLMDSDLEFDEEDTSITDTQKIYRGDILESRGLKRDFAQLKKEMKGCLSRTTLRLRMPSFGGK